MDDNITGTTLIDPTEDLRAKDRRTLTIALFFSSSGEGAQTQWCTKTSSLSGSIQRFTIEETEVLVTKKQSKVKMDV